MPGLSVNNPKPNLSDAERDGVVQFLLQRYAGDKLEKGAISEATEKFSVSRRTIGSIWKRPKECMQSGAVSIDARSKIKKNSGRKKRIVMLS
jgi:hypothetical protein